MSEFKDSTLWRISAYERMRLERSSSAFAQFGENTLLPTTLLADLRHLGSHREGGDVLEVLAACMRHRQSALVCLQYEDLVWPLTVFPGELVYHSPRDMALAAPDGLSALKLLSFDAPGLRPPGHWMQEAGRPHGALPRVEAAAVEPGAQRPRAMPCCPRLPARPPTA